MQFTEEDYDNIVQLLESNYKNLKGRIFSNQEKVFKFLVYDKLKSSPLKTVWGFKFSDHPSDIFL